MDPVTAMATASAAFGAIKKGFAVGRDVESMMSDIGRWMGALSDLDQAEREAKNPPIFKKLFAGKTVEQEAMEVFAAKRKAQAQRDELKQWISLTLGQSAWEELVRTEGRIRKQRQETLYAQRERRRKFIEISAWVLLVSVGAAVLGAFVLLLKAHTANAAEQMTICRKVKCEKLEGRKMVCIYRGQNNTIESQFFGYGEFIPQEYQCKYDPNARKEITVQETLKAIRESQK
tara:strand:- start:1609 stop:2304 length:696 start_codon:yes stop_codon:yes gene_type:complete